MQGLKAPLPPQHAHSVHRPPVFMFAHPSMEDLADSIVRLCSSCTDSQGTGSQGTGSQGMGQPVAHGRDVVFKKTIKWERFKDGWPNLFIEDVKDVAGKDVLFLASFHSPQVVFEQLSILYAMPRYLARSFHLILPYFPTGTMERVDTEGQIATAKTLATLLSSIPLTARGPAQVMLIDIHALPERFYFSESVIPRLETAIPLLQRELLSLPPTDQLAVAFPDEGAFKRFHSMFEGYATIVCHKIRDKDKRIVKVRDGDATGRHVVIVDDLVQTGGTLIECAKALRARGATRISAYATHAVFPEDSWQRFTAKEEQFENFWVTDSIPHARSITQNPPFKLLSLSGVIADVLLGYDLNTSCL